MARRVNTKFVITLGTTLATIGLGGGGYLGWKIYQSRDPKYLMNEAAAMEKSDQPSKALQLYHKAAARAVATQMVGTEDLCMKVAELSLKQSDQELDREKAQLLYVDAERAWQQALGVNPKYLPAREKLIEEDYLYQMLQPNAGGLTRLEANADKLIELAPTYANAYLYRARARYILLVSGAGGGMTVNDTLAKVQQDAQKALDLSPNDGRTVSLLAMVKFMQARQAGAQSLTKDATKLQDEGVDLLHKFLVKHPNNPEATITLCEALRTQNQNADALKLLEEAYAANPHNQDLANILIAVYGASDLAKSEKIAKDFIAADPTAMEEYAVLASIEEQMGKLPEATATYKEMLNHPKSGGGVNAFKNTRYEMQGLYSVSKLYMDMAEKEGVTTAAGKADLAQASTFADRFRAEGGDAGPQGVLDGRLQLLESNVSQALVYLKRAEANLGGGNPMPGRVSEWTDAKLLLVNAYIMQQEWGEALDRLQEVRLNRKDMLWPKMQQATLFNKVGRYNEAQATADGILAIPNLPPVLRDQALRLKAAALYGLGYQDDAGKLIASIDSTTATLVLARTDIANDNYDDAIDALNRVFEKDPNNLTALTWAIHVYMLMDRKTEAQKLVDRALVKYPNNTDFQVLKAKLGQPSADTMEAQAELLKSITDDYARAVAYAQLYNKYGNLTKEFAALQDAEKAAGDSSSGPMINVVKQAFNVLLAEADAAKDPKDKQKYWDTARIYVQKAQRLNLDGANGALLQAKLQFAQGDKKGAIQTLEQTLADHPDYSQAHTILGLIYGNDGNSDAALEHLRQAIKEKPDDVQALKGAIRLLLHKGDSGSGEEARNYLKQVMIFARHDPEVMSFADVLGDTPAAIETREQIRKKEPDNLENLERLALLYVQNKQPKKAIDCLQPVYEKNPDDLGLADTLSRLYRDNEQINAAETIYERFLASKDIKVRFQAMLRLGELYNSLNRTDQAIQTFTEAIKEKPDEKDDGGERHLADLYFDHEDMKDAEDLYQKIYDNGQPKDITVLLRIVETQIRQGKYKESNDLLQNVIFKQNPTDPEGLVLQGFSYLRQGNPQDALAKFNEVLAKDPNNIDGLHYRAYAQYALQGDMDQAAKDLIKVRDQNPNAISSRLLLAKVYRLSQRLSEAAAEYRDVIKLRPDYVPARAEYGQFLLQLARIQQRLSPDNQDDVAFMIRSVQPMETLQALLNDSMTRFPDNPIWQIMAGDFLTLVGRQADAQQKYGLAFNMSATGSPQAQAYFATAAEAYLDSLLKTRNYEEVIDLTTRIAAMHPDDVSNYIKRATAYVATGKNDEAMADYEHALSLGEHNLTLVIAVMKQMLLTLPPAKVASNIQAKLTANPGDPAARIGLAQALLSLDRASEAAQTVAPMKKDQTVQDKAMVLRVAALAEYESKDFASATTDYQDLLKIVPDDIEALNNLSFLLADDLHKPQEGLPYAVRAAKVLRANETSIAFVNNGNVYDTLGWVEALGGDSDAGIRDLKRAIQSDPTAIAYYHLSKTYQKAGRKDEAIKADQDGLKAVTDPKDPVGSQLEALRIELGK